MKKKYKLDPKKLIEYKIKMYAISGETRQETIDRLKKGKTKFGKLL